jgi:uncharacterized protein involved in type VI secretion and phage assembly
MAENGSNGIVIGIVTDLDDPAGLGRVRVQYPHLGDEPSDWARLAVPMAGNGRGTFFRPEVDDEVLVAFEHCDPRRPYVLGALWSQADPPPPEQGSARDNNWRFIQSRSGHIILLDDTAGQEKIELIDKDGLRRVKIDSANGKIEVTCSQGDVQVSAASGEVKVEGLTVVVEAQSSLTLQCNGPTTIKGNPVAIN